MRNNVLSVDNQFSKQVNGTAMGTPCACSYNATIYYSYHEETVLLQPNIAPIFYLRLIDNADMRILCKL
jgi:hypothetical protein